MIKRRSLLLGGLGTVAAAALTGGARAGATTLAGPKWDTLRAKLTGTLVLPSDSAYPVAKQLFWGMYDSISPQAVAYCQTAADVVSSVQFAQANGIRAIPRSGGHSFGGYSTGTGLIVDVSRINGAQMGASTVKVGGGAAAVDVLSALSPYGVAVPAGSHSSVGLGGYIQGGGSGWLTRTAGLASDRVVSAQVVLANGRLVTASASQNPQLYWALRGGGGGNFGIVTQYELNPVPVTTMTNFTYVFPWDAAEALLTAWQQWALRLPDEISSALNFLLQDAGPGKVPAVYAIGVSFGSDTALKAQLDALVAAVGTQPLAAYVTPGGYYNSMMSWFRCSQLTVQQCHRIGTTPDGQIDREPYSLNRNRLLKDPIPADKARALLAAFDANRTAGHLRVVSYSMLGGQANALSRTSTAFVHRDTQFLLDIATELFTPVPGPQDAQAARTWVDDGFAVIDSVSNGESYQNFIDPALPDWRKAYYAENYSALVAAKHCYDPYNYFRFAQGIGA
jgi:FAD/FMN-containing dehydrogenase